MWTLTPTPTPTPTLTPTPGVVHKPFWTSSRRAKKYWRGDNVADEIDTALSVTSVGLAASGVGLLSTIIAAPVAIGLQAGAIVCGLLGAGGILVGRKLQAKGQKTRF